MATWGKAFSDFNKIEERSKNPPWWEKTFKGSDEENAVLIWNQLEEARAPAGAKAKEAVDKGLDYGADGP